MSGRGLTVLDRVYEHVTLPPVVRHVLNTRWLQRLRGLAQLGASSYTYPSATHTRFEHSIGVAHLATVLLRSVQETHGASLGLTEEEITLVAVAGLMHDAGHGPFSHLFEDGLGKRLQDRRQQQQQQQSTTATTIVASSSPAVAAAPKGFCHEDMTERIIPLAVREVGAGVLGPEDTATVMAMAIRTETYYKHQGRHKQERHNWSTDVPALAPHTHA